MLTLSLFDPAGWRGSGHRHGTQHDVSIGPHAASPGYVAGPLPPGAWQAVVDTHMIMPGTPCAIRMEIAASDEPAAEAPSAASGSSAPFGVGGETAGLSPLGPKGLDFRITVHTAGSRKPASAVQTTSRGRGWYRGDLHAHSLHSDAAWDIPDIVAWARESRLDFATLSDHNTISGLAQMDEACTAELLTMGGMEFTTFWGHALALGIRGWVDWRMRADAGAASRTIEQMPAGVEALGGLFVIAHPMAIGDPYCTGCQWRYPTMTPGTATAVEVWNSDWRSESRNELGLSLAYEWLNAGHRLALTAGTDNHGRNHRAMHYGFNVVYADDLSEREILRAVRAGHLYISAGPTLELSAAVGDRQAEGAVPSAPPCLPRAALAPCARLEAASRRAMMGDLLYVSRGQDMQVTASWSGCPEGAELCLVADGKPKDTMPAGNEDTRVWKLEGGETHWCLLTLRGAEGQMLALTNPIFFDGRP